MYTLSGKCGYTKPPKNLYSVTVSTYDIVIDLFFGNEDFDLEDIFRLLLVHALIFSCIPIYTKLHPCILHLVVRKAHDVEITF